MCTDGKPHDTVTVSRQLGDGSQKPVVICLKCSAEWS